MSHPLGVHFIPTHTGQHHYDHIRALRPPLAKLIGSEFPDVQQMADMYAAAPGALHIWRNHALSEQHGDLWRDPVGTAHRHVNELHRDIQIRAQQAKERGLTLPPREQVRILGINEPVVELFPRREDGSNYGDWLRMMRERTPILDAYMATFGEAANHLGYGAELGNFPPGQVANLKPGAYPTLTWFPRTIKLLERTRGRNALAQHEYWRAETGPEAWWDWYTCRFFHYEADCDIHILECGVEQAITGGDNHGWQGLISPEQYAGQMRTYLLRCMTDSRFGGATPFTLDGGDRWKTFYLEPAMPHFEALARELEQVTPAARPQPQPSTIFLPSVHGGIPTIPSGKAEPKPVTPQPQLPDVLDPLALEAIIKVESGGRNFGPDGRLLIRFEAHIFRAKLGNDPLWAQHFQVGEPAWTNQMWRRWSGGSWLPIHTGNQASEWEAFEFALTLDRSAAQLSISMGAPQIMGFNHARIGYRTPGAMFAAFSRSDDAQVAGLLNFIWSNDDLAIAINAHDWQTVARLYNGAGQVDHYAGLMANAYAQLAAP